MIKDQIDWQAIQDEAVEILRNYVKINTTNPPGNELEAALYLREILKKDDIDATIYEPAPHRANLVARLPGSSGEGALVLLNHMDVVPVEEDKWDVDPFAGIVKNGYICGRGAIDMKGSAVAQLMTVLLLKRHKIPLKRDILFLATADEETGGRLGVKWMMDHDPRLKQAAFVLNEGGGIMLLENGEVSHYEISTAQKVVCQFTLRARGASGHGSMPHQDSANVKLIRALNRLVEWETPFVVIPLVKEYFANLARIKPAEESEAYRNIEEALYEPSFVASFTANPYYNAMVRNTVTPTVLKAGSKVNVIPSDAEAAFDCRILPGASCNDFFIQISELLNDEVELAPVAGFDHFSPPPSPTDNELYRAIQTVAQRRNPGCVVTPVLITGATDSRFFRKAEVPCYDFSPLRLTHEDLRLVHGHNERLSIENLGFASQFMFEMVQEVTLK